MVLHLACGDSSNCKHSICSSLCGRFFRGPDNFLPRVCCRPPFVFFTVLVLILTTIVQAPLGKAGDSFVLPQTRSSFVEYCTDASKNLASLKVCGSHERHVLLLESVGRKQ